MGQNYLKQWRTHRGLTQQALADAVSTTKAVISLLENEKRPLSTKWLRRIAETLRTNPGDILDRSPDGGDIDAKPQHYLREWRKFRNLTQHKLAKLAGTTPSQISMLELSERGLTLTWLRRLSPFLGATPGDLIERHPPDNGESELPFASEANGKPPHLLRAWRKFRGMTLAAVAQEIDLSNAQLSRIETGNQPYNQELLEGLADVYGCEVVDLLVRNPIDESATDSVQISDDDGKPLHHLWAWRKFRQMTQQELADAVDTGKAVISDMERGKLQLSPKWLRKFAPVLKTQPGHILDYDPEELGGDIMGIWSRIDEADREMAARVLRSFVRTDRASTSAR